MKKLICLLLVFGLLLCLAACGKAKNEGETIEVDPGAALAGGWAAAEEPAVTDERLALFDKAMAGLVGVDYTPLVYLGSQVVAGRNHAFLCQAQVVYPDAQPYFAIVYIYEALDGACEILSIAPIVANADGISEAPQDPSAAVGAWTAPAEPDILIDMEEDFAKATEGLVGVDYTPLCLLATQVVAGVNYAVLCQARTVTPGAQPSYAVVSYYAALDGSCELMNVSDFDFGAYCVY